MQASGQLSRIAAVAAMRVEFSHSEYIWCWRDQQLPQGIGNGTTTRSPTARSPRLVCSRAFPRWMRPSSVAGTGATVAKGGDAWQIRPGGFGLASAKVGEATVTAAMVVNSVGGVWDDDRHEWVAELSNWDRASSLVPGANIG